MMKKRMLAMLCLLALFSTLLTGCGGKVKTDAKYDYRTADLGSDPVTLTVATKQGSSNGLSALKEAFENEYPNVTVQVVTTYNIVDGGFATENVDIYMSSYEYELWNPNYASIWEDSCVDYKEADLVDLSGFNRDLLASATKDGKIYTLPLMTGTVGILTNMDLLKACGISTAPETTEELLAACAAVKQAGYQPFRCMPTSLTYLVEGMTEYEVCTDKANDAFANAALKATDEVGNYFASASDFLSTAAQNGYLDTEAMVYIPEAESNGGNEQAMTTYMQECYAFLNGDVAFFPCYSALLSSLAKRETRSEAYIANAFQYSLIPVPTKYGAAPIRTSEFSLNLNKNSSVLPWAERFVQFCFWREDDTTVGNTAIFADAQCVMTPYDTDKIYSEASQRHYAPFHSLFKNDSSCLANDPALLAYDGKGMYAGCVKYGFDVLGRGDTSVDILSAAPVSADAVRQKFVDACTSWFIDGNVY